MLKGQTQKKTRTLLSPDFLPKHRKIIRTCPEMAPFFCAKPRSRETLVIFPSDSAMLATTNKMIENPFCSGLQNKLLTLTHKFQKATESKHEKNTTQLGQDYYQTYSRTRVERVYFLPFLSPEYRRINRKWPEMATFLLHESHVARNSGDIPFPSHQHPNPDCCSVLLPAPLHESLDLYQPRPPTFWKTGRFLGRTFTGLTRVSLVTRVCRRIVGALFGLKHRKIGRKPPKVGLHETLVIVPSEKYRDTHTRNGHTHTHPKQATTCATQAWHQKCLQNVVKHPWWSSRN